MHNPHFQKAYETVYQIHREFIAEIAFIELSWEKIYNGVLENGEPRLVQIAPTILTQAKG